MAIKTALRAAAVAGAGCLTMAAAAQAGPLSVVNVAAPGINCVFSNVNAPACQVVVQDFVGMFSLPGDNGLAELRSRTYAGTAPAPATGDMAYVYRLDMTKVQGVAAPNCVSKLALDFGPVVKLPYGPKGDSDVFVVTSGGIGTVALSSAAQVGNTVTFTFASPVCPGATSYFFGLASKISKPAPGKEKISFSLGGGTTTADRVP